MTHGSKEVQGKKAKAGPGRKEGKVGRDVAAKKKTRTQSESCLKRIERMRQLIDEPGPCYWLAKRRITPAMLAKEIEEHIHATSVKVFHHKGEILYSEPLRDWNVQFRAIELAVTLWGMMKPKEGRDRETESLRDIAESLRDLGKRND